MDKCKYCDKLGTYSFGWLDSEGVWQDRHLACDDHKLISFNQQSYAVEIAQLHDKWRNWGKNWQVKVNLDSGS